jgi:lysophospholipase L1-like esterase
MIYGVVLCIGDSLLTGARNEAGLSVPMFLGDALSIGEQKWIAIDEAVNGETTGTLLRHCYKTVRAYPEAQDVVLCVGTNDAKEPALSREHFQRNYRELTKIFAILKKRAFLCTIPKQAGFGAPDRIDADAIRTYNELILDRHRMFPGSTLVDLAKIPKGHRADGIHFNLAGDQWAANLIASSIMKANS